MVHLIFMLWCDICKQSSICDQNKTLWAASVYCPNIYLLAVYEMALCAVLLFLLPASWACAPQKAGSRHTIKNVSIKVSLLDRFPTVVQFDSYFCCVFSFLDYVMISCFPNAIIANVPECPYGWEIGQLSLGGVCYTGVNTPGFYRFTIPDLTPRNLSYCATLSEVKRSTSFTIIFINSFRIAS